MKRLASSMHCAVQATCSDDEGLSVDSEDAASPPQLSTMDPDPEQGQGPDAAEGDRAGAPEHAPGAAAASGLGSGADPGGWLAYPQLYLGPPGPAGSEAAGPAAPIQADGSGAGSAEEPLSMQERQRRAARAVRSCGLHAVCR